MKSSEFRYLCDNVYSKVCFVKFVALVLLWYWKKIISIKLGPDIYIVPSKNESEDPAKKDLDWMKEVFSSANRLEKIYVKPPGLNHASSRFRTSFFMAVPFWVIRVCQVCFFLSIRYKNLAFEKTLVVHFLVSVKQMHFCNIFFTDEF